MNKGRIFVIDLETWGLHYLDDPILEIGLSIRGLDLHQIGAYHSLVWDSPYYEMLLEKRTEANKASEDGDIVYRMHSESGLFEDAFSRGEESHVVADDLMTWLDQQNVNPKEDYLAGSSVHFDSTMMFFNFKEIRERFHHRVIDTSSIKVMSELWYPNTAAEMKKMITPAKKHRVIPDIEDTVEELRWYLDNLLPEDDEVNA